MKSNVTVVILAAGLGTRMRSGKAKVLHEAGGDTLLNSVIKAALSVAEAEQIIAVVGHQAAQVRASVKVPGIRFAEQSEQKGTGHAVLSASTEAERRTGHLMVLNGDGPLLRDATLRALLVRAGEYSGGALVTTIASSPEGYGRIVRDADGLIRAIVEQKAASAEQLEIREINTGVYCFAAEPFWRLLPELKANPASGEYYLTDMVEILRRNGHKIAPLVVEDESELLGINTRVELAVADKVLRTRKTNELMLSGVTIENPATVMIDADVEIGADTVIESNVHLRGLTRIGARCHIGTGTVLRDCIMEDDARTLPYVVAEASRIATGASVGPFSRMRLYAEAAERSVIGNFVELKNARLGAGSKAQHLAYLGDAAIGAGSNIGAGTITCNFDGTKKHRTTIGENVFVGSNSTLVAPLELADGSFVAAGSVITKDVEADGLAIGRAQQVVKAGWAKRRRALAKKA